MKLIKTIPLLSLFILQFSISPCSAQNLVPNPSFEEYDTCPTSQGEIKYSTNWNSFGYSPDYVNRCNGSGWGVPLNNLGYQIPATGNAYVGIGTYSKMGENREYIGIKLLSPLIIGIKYYVSFKVCLSDNPSIAYANNKLGVLFSTVSYSVDSFCPPPCTTTLLFPRNFANIYTDSIITDTTNWTIISGSFIVDSTYQYIIIGNHFDNAHTDIISLDPFGSNVAGYYLIDDIYVGTDSLTDIEINDYKSTLNVYPNPACDFITIDWQNIDEVSSSYNLFDSYGRLIKQGNIICERKINVSDLKNGVYFLCINSKTYVFTKKIIISKP